MDPKGEIYSASNEHHVVFARELLTRVTVDDQWRYVVDLGCGSGEVTRELAHKFPHATIHAYDKFESMVEQARSVNRHPRVEYRVLDVERPIPDSLHQQADFLTSIHVLHWTPDLTTPLQNIHRILKPNGRFFIVHVLENRIQNLQEYLTQKFPQLSSSWYDELFFIRKIDPSREYRKVCEEIGLDVDIQTLRLYHTIPEEKLNHEMISVMFPSMEGLPQSLRSHVENAIIEFLKSNCENGTLHRYVDDLVVTGMKL